MKPMILYHKGAMSNLDGTTSDIVLLTLIRKITKRLISETYYIH